MTDLTNSVIPAQAGIHLQDTNRLQSREMTSAMRKNDGENLDSAAAEFEAIFARMMLASMRQASLGEDILGGKGGDMFRGRFDGEVASTLGERGALGIGRALADYLARGKAEGPTT